MEESTCYWYIYIDTVLNTKVLNVVFNSILRCLLQDPNIVDYDKLNKGKIKHTTILLE